MKQFKYTLTKKFEFHAAHSLKGAVPDSHKCAVLHGHTYKGEMKLHAVDLEDHLVVDAGILSAVISQLDHKNLNDVLHHPASVENIARWIAEATLNTLFKLGIENSVQFDYVELWETDSLSCRVTLEDVE